MVSLQKLSIEVAVSVVIFSLSAATLAQQAYPSKPIRIVIPSTAASTPDILARLIGAKMSDSWKQPVVIDNRPPLIAFSLVAKSTPDGYTLILAAPSIAIRAALLPNLPYDTLKDFVGVTAIGFSNTVVVVSPTLGVKSVKELVAYADARPGKIFFATAVVGSADHMTVERFKFAAGIKAQHVSFKGQAESLIETAAGRSHFTTAGLTAALPLIKDGKLVALAQLVPGLPDVPLASEVVPLWKQMGRQAIYAPTGTPMAIRLQLSKEVARILSLPDIRERLQSVAFQITPGTPEELDHILRADIAAFAKVIKDIGLKPN